MLTQLRLKHFQAHTAAVFPLAPITTFTGPSDVGKSAVVRALTWLITNKPGGQGFIQSGSAEAAVGLEVDGLKILRKKSGGDNLYKVTTADGEYEYRAFGTGVPQAVDEELRTVPASIQSQLDPPFWLALSGAQAADALSEIANLSLLSTMQRNASTQVRAHKDELTLVERQIAAADATLLAGAPVVALGELLEACEAEQRLVDEATQLRDAVSREWLAASDLCERIRRAEWCVAHATMVLSYEQATQRLREQRTQLHASAELLFRCSALLTHSDTLTKMTAKAAQLVEKEAELATAKRQLAAMKETTSACRRAAEAVHQATTSVEAAAIKHAAALLEESKANKGKRCPTCQQTLK